MVKDTFSRLDIARDASGVVIECVTQLHGFRGGGITIGEGAFEVAVLGRAHVGEGRESEMGIYSKFLL